MLYQSHSYMRPLIKPYKSKKFIKRSKVLLDFLKTGPLSRVNVKEETAWVRVSAVNQRKLSNPKSGWRPKLYVCVSPEDYWEVVLELIQLTNSEKLNWKFCKHFGSFHRPDKIVIYCSDTLSLRKVIK